jgi:hypothetical protein
MRAPSSTAILAAVLLLPLAARADPNLPEEAHARGLTLGLMAVQPLPPWNDAGFGLAPWAGFTLPVWRNLLATARVGYIGHFEKTSTAGSADSESIDYSSWELPVLLGVEYALPGFHGFLFSGEVGYVLCGSGAEYSREADTSSTDHRAVVALGAGYRIWRIEVRVHWIMLGLPDPVKQKAVMFGVQWLLPI